MSNLSKTKNFKWAFILLFALLAFFLFWLFPLVYTCEKTSNLERALQLSKENRTELEKVLRHFKQRPADTLKLRAAEFLIENMPGNYSFDSSSLVNYRPILYLYDSLNKIKRNNSAFRYSQLLRDAWRSQKDKYGLYENIFNKPILEDIRAINSSYLIENIEMAFEAWRQARAWLTIDFNSFCKYVLPYRRYQGLCLENWRKHFQQDSIRLKFNLREFTIQNFVDSVLWQYGEFMPKGLKHAGSDIPDFPYLKLSDLLIAKRSMCEARCWFNSMLLSSLGLPATVDYVPAWGNRNNSHAWNAIIVNNSPIPFESFWDRDRWKYKKFYSNKTADRLWGSFRLPKVFRYSYTAQPNALQLDKSVAASAIPPFFRLEKQEDVSDEYFQTSDVKIEIAASQPRANNYAWLCTYNSGKWTPVQWALVKNNTATFLKMGRDVVYLPAFYKDEILVPASSAFLLQPNGAIKPLIPTHLTESIIIKRKFPEFPHLIARTKMLLGSKIQVANRRDFTDAKTVYEVMVAPDLFMHTVKLSTSHKYRYVRFLFPYIKKALIPASDGFPDEAAARLAEFEALGNANGQEKNEILKGEVLHSKNFNKPMAQKIFDNNTLTYAVNEIGDGTKKEECWIGLDLKRPAYIRQIGYCPQNDGNNIFPELHYELFYWNNQWVSLGIQKATEHRLIYKEVPKGALLRLCCRDEGREDRPFFYVSGKQDWR